MRQSDRAIKYSYKPVNGFFQQTECKEDSDESKGVRHGQKAFGLRDDHSVDRWRKIVDLLEKQPDTPKEGKPAIKLLFVGRHGEGIHNIAQDKYGHEKWNNEMGKKTGDDELTWGPDPSLTDKGIEEAKEMGRVWKYGMEASPPIPFPEVFYCSPLRRPSQTLYYTFMDSGLLAKDHTVHVREGLREFLDTKQEQRRRPLSELQKEFPSWQPEEGQDEEDTLWSADREETHEEMGKRAGEVLDEIFSKREKCVSVTCHSVLIEGLLAYTQHPVFFAPRGAAFAVLLEGTVKTD